jgi:hypothetical protein
MSIEVIDNFLERTDFEIIQQELLGSYFPWYYNNSVTYDNPDNNQLIDFQFTHTFYVESKITSDWFYLMNGLLKKINPSKILRIKANLNTISSNIFQYDMHVDFDNFLGKTAIFYVNSNNGYTVFENGLKVGSQENRLVVFNSDLLHAGTTCTDQKIRCVINFNFDDQ